MTVNGIHSCSNRISSFTIHADTPEGFNRKQRITVHAQRQASCLSLSAESAPPAHCVSGRMCIFLATCGRGGAREMLLLVCPPADSDLVQFRTAVSAEQHSRQDRLSPISVSLRLPLRIFYTISKVSWSIMASWVFSKITHSDGPLLTFFFDLQDFFWVLKFTV